MGKGLLCALRELTKHHDQEYNQFYLPNGFYHPGYLVTMTAYLHLHRIENRGFDSHPETTGYLEAMALSSALWRSDTYNQPRTNEGRNYSVITPLHNIESVDTATASINGCIRSLTHNAQHQGVADLCHVVGELHDNVWSHGQSSGFSMAQRTKVPNEDDHYLEFSLADCGAGFLSETNRVGMNLQSHQEAIEWCLVEGNSTKHGDDIEEWAQFLPHDNVGGSPFGAQVDTRSDDNHHQGLGLAHLVTLVRRYGGELTLASGDTCFKIDEAGRETYSSLENAWQGVAISCKFRESMLCQDLQDSELEHDELLASIFERLGG